MLINFLFSAENGTGEEDDDQGMAPTQPKLQRTNRRVVSVGENDVDDHQPILDDAGRRMCPRCKKWYNEKNWLDFYLHLVFNLHNFCLAWW